MIKSLPFGSLTITEADEPISEIVDEIETVTAAKREKNFFSSYKIPPYLLLTRLAFYANGKRKDVDISLCL